MRKLVDYKIVCGSHVEEVEKSIRDYIGDGWELLGPAYCCQDRHCQTIVKYEERSPEPPRQRFPRPFKSTRKDGVFDGLPQPSDNPLNPRGGKHFATFLVIVILRDNEPRGSH